MSGFQGTIQAEQPTSLIQVTNLILIESMEQLSVVVSREGESTSWLEGGGLPTGHGVCILVGQILPVKTLPSRNFICGR